VSPADRPSDAGSGAGPGSDPERGRRVVLFDMDGVLIQGRGTDAVVHERALDDALAERGLDPDTETRRLLSGYEYDAEFAGGCARLGVDPITFYELREQYSAQRTVDRLDAEARTPYPDVSALADLAGQYPLGVVSNNYDTVVRFVVDRYGLDVFDHVSGRATGVRGFYRRKPDPHYLLDAMDALGGTDGLYVGDRGTDVLAAARAGIDAAFLERPHNESADLPVEPTVVVDSLTALVEWLQSRQ